MVEELFKRTQAEGVGKKLSALWQQKEELTRGLGNLLEQATSGKIDLTTAFTRWYGDSHFKDLPSSERYSKAFHELNLLATQPGQDGPNELNKNIQEFLKQYNPTHLDPGKEYKLNPVKISPENLDSIQKQIEAQADQIKSMEEKIPKVRKLSPDGMKKEVNKYSPGGHEFLTPVDKNEKIDKTRDHVIKAQGGIRKDPLIAAGHSILFGKKGASAKDIYEGKETQTSSYL